MLDLKTVHFYEEVVLTNTKLEDLELKPLESVVGKMSKPCIFSTRHGNIIKAPSDLKRGRGVSLKSAVDKDSYFISMCKDIHGGVYDYSITKYKGHNKKVDIICKKHGRFKQDPFNILCNKAGCPKCGNNTPTKDEFLKRANNKHNFKYNYNLSDYVNMTTHIEIECKKHGVFKQKPYTHLESKYGCNECFLENGAVYYSLKSAKLNKDKWLKKEAIFYVVNLYNNEENFFKIGITTKSLKRRFGKSFEKKTGYTINEVFIQKTNLYNAFMKENNIIKNMREYRYIPRTTFGGVTECFCINPLIQDNE